MAETDQSERMNNRLFKPGDIVTTPFVTKNTEWFGTTNRKETRYYGRIIERDQNGSYSVGWFPPVPPGHEHNWAGTYFELATEEEYQLFLLQL